ncbi:MAG TPA: hypothetical protein VN325_23585 [Steroidobacteraceae bacterium]|nr:hypothetical protein [Steroidobacteraceae bacterium]
MRNFPKFFALWAITGALMGFSAFAPAKDNPPAEAAPNLTGLHNFDFLAGEWRAHHRQLKERLAGSHDWVEFDGTLLESRQWWRSRVFSA